MILFLSRHMEEALQEDSMLPKNLRLTAIQQVVVTPSKFSASFNFFKDNLDKLISV